MSLRRHDDLSLRFDDAGSLEVRLGDQRRAISRQLLEVLGLCDGARDAAAIASRLDWGASPAAQRLLVERALIELEDAGLLVPADAPRCDAYFASYADPAVHRAFVSDRGRTEAYRRAIAATVRPGDVVVEVGAGTGILALFAAAAGARVVHAIEPAPIVKLAREVAAATPHGGQIVFHAADAETLTLPEPADVLIADWVGRSVIRERIFPAVAAQRDRTLRHGGRLIPGRVRLQAALIEDPEARALGPEFWGSRPFGVRCEALRDAEYAQPQSVIRTCPADTVLAPPRDLRVFDPYTLQPDALREVSGSATWTLDRAATLDAVSVSFVSELAPGVAFDTGPTALPTFFQQEVLPLPPCPLVAGAEVALELTLTSAPQGPRLRLIGTAGPRQLDLTYL